MSLFSQTALLSAVFRFVGGKTVCIPKSHIYSPDGKNSILWHIQWPCNTTCKFSFKACYVRSKYDTHPSIHIRWTYIMANTVENSSIKVAARQMFRNTL